MLSHLWVQPQFSFRADCYPLKGRVCPLKITRFLELKTLWLVGIPST